MDVLLALWRTNQKIMFLFFLTFIWGKNSDEKRLAVKVSNGWPRMSFQLVRVGGTYANKHKRMGRRYKVDGKMKSLVSVR